MFKPLNPSYFITDFNNTTKEESLVQYVLSNYSYCVEAIGNYERLKEENEKLRYENEILTKERFVDLMECKDEAIKQLRSENIELTEFSVKKRTFELYRNKEEEIDKCELY